jgi:Na+/H+ antiporter
MASFTIVLIMLSLVIVSSVLARVLPISLPLPLIQICLGVLVAIFTEDAVVLEPHLFFLLFLPPLLFIEGWRIPKAGLLNDAGMIFELAFGLVIFTVLGIGLFLHWLIPAMPYAVCFALAAVLSPTDPVAVSSLTKKMPIPKRFMHILEGESLLNDATGLVCLRFAIAAALTGVFSLPDATLVFLWLVVGGVGSGVALTFVVTLTKDFFYRHFGEESGTQILISLILPFAAYILAEHINSSGILAAVAAGIAMSYAEQSGRAMASTRVRRHVVWDVIGFSLNGVIFVLLGEQLPSIYKGARDVILTDGVHGPVWLFLYVAVVTIALAVARFTWVVVSMKLSDYINKLKKNEVPPSFSLGAALLMTVSGVRGAITLAGILTLPLLMSDGSEFPSRDLAIFIAAGVIILSMLLATIFLPLVIKYFALPDHHDLQSVEEMARVAASQAAIEAVDTAYREMASDKPDPEIYAAVASRIMDHYRRVIEGNSDEGEDTETMRYAESIERKLSIIALGAARNKLFHLSRTRKIDDDVMRRLVREIDLSEARYQI